jgi:uncharacterized membrane protein
MADVQTRPSRIWRTVLVISLALNLAVAGIIGGAMVSGRFGDRPAARIDFGVGPVARALTEVERRAIGRELRADRSLRGHDFRGQMAAVAAALRADPYDPAATRALLEDQAARLSQLQARARMAVLDRIAEMPPDRRRAFADRLEQELMR